MSAWRDLVQRIAAELLRCSQRDGGRQVLPNAIAARLPAASFERFGPVLAQIAEEVGQRLEAWADKQAHRWYGGAGPSLDLLIEGREGSEITVAFRGPEETSA